MTLRVKVAREDLAYLSAAAGYDDSHRYRFQSADSAISLITTIPLVEQRAHIAAQKGDLHEEPQNGQRSSKVEDVFHFGFVADMARKK